MGHQHSTASVKALLFLIGLFSATQIHIVGFIGISELIVFLVAPFVFLADYYALRKHGYLPVLVLSMLVVLGCVVSSWFNHAGFRNLLKGMASPYAVFAFVVVLHRLLVKAPPDFKWLLVGMACSGVLSIFVFQAGTARVVDGDFLSGAAAMESVTSYALFWVSLLRAWLLLPITCWYLQTPLAYSALTPLALGAYALLSTESGRSAFLGAAMAAFLIVLGGKNQKRMGHFRRHSWAIAILAIVSLLTLKTVYTVSASNGWLGEQAREKYVLQSRRGNSILSLLMGGRIEFFAGAYACCKSPLVGQGPWALDYDDLYGAFLTKYGTSDDLTAYDQIRLDGEREGQYNWIPAHSHIIGFWLWYGIFGLVFWLYVLWIVFDVFKNHLSVVPAFYGYFAVTMPAFLWAVFFSPFGGRLGASLLITMCLLVRGIHKNRIAVDPQLLRD